MHDDSTEIVTTTTLLLPLRPGDKSWNERWEGTRVLA